MIDLIKLYFSAFTRLALGGFLRPLGAQVAMHAGGESLTAKFQVLLYLGAIQNRISGWRFWVVRFYNPVFFGGVCVFCFLSLVRN